MTNNSEPSSFGVKFWLASAGLLSFLAIFNSMLWMIHAKSQHADWWALTGFTRFIAILIPWGASVANYRRIKAVAIELAASDKAILTIQYCSAMMLSMICVAIMVILNATTLP